MMGGTECVPDFVLPGEVQGNQLQDELLDLRRQLGRVVVHEYPRALEVLDDLRQVGPGELVLLETRDEQNVQEQSNIRSTALRRAVARLLAVGIGTAHHPLLLDIDQELRDRTELERDGVDLV